uniref:Uncharacterized protein n=1 Tax=Pipistrellus kuhlii TaxID=59472 RepID=A0A7J7UGG3_PIPKU|nr:hypothetical protein mPipKuh1_009090 [Pipistrellus kuhlii]
MNNGLANRAQLLSKQPKRQTAQMKPEKRECKGGWANRRKRAGICGAGESQLRVSATSFLGTELPCVLRPLSATHLPHGVKKNEPIKCSSAVAQMERLRCKLPGSVVSRVVLSYCGREFGMRVGGRVPS